MLLPFLLVPLLPTQLPPLLLLPPLMLLPPRCLQTEGPAPPPVATHVHQLVVLDVQLHEVGQLRQVAQLAQLVARQVEHLQVLELRQGLHGAHGGAVDVQAQEGGGQAVGCLPQLREAR